MYAGVVAGNNTGEAWVDDLSDPAFCMVWSEYLSGFHFMGTCCEHINGGRLRAFIDGVIVPFLKGKGVDSFAFSCDHRAWFLIICEMLPHEMKKGKQYVFRLMDKSHVNTELILPIGYEMLELNMGFASGELARMENYGAIHTEIEKTWGCIDKFLELGKGFVAVCDGVICGFASTHMRYKYTYSFGTEIYNTHKRKGLSSFLTMTLLGAVISESADVWWDCGEGNVASQKTAQKVGLTFSHEYEIGWFDIK